MRAQKWYVLGGFGYHGNLLVVFGFWFLVRRVSNFVRRYSRSGLECPNDPGRLLSINNFTEVPTNEPQQSRRLQHVDPVPIIPSKEHVPSSLSVKKPSISSLYDRISIAMLVGRRVT